jgi:hypothetical protein
LRSPFTVFTNADGSNVGAALEAERLVPASAMPPLPVTRAAARADARRLHLEPLVGDRGAGRST